MFEDLWNDTPLNLPQEGQEVEGDEWDTGLGPARQPTPGTWSTGMSHGQRGIWHTGLPPEQQNTGRIRRIHDPDDDFPEPPEAYPTDPDPWDDPLDDDPDDYGPTIDPPDDGLPF